MNVVSTESRVALSDPLPRATPLHSHPRAFADLLVSCPHNPSSIADHCVFRLSSSGADGNPFTREVILPYLSPFPPGNPISLPHIKFHPRHRCFGDETWFNRDFFLIELWWKRDEDLIIPVRRSSIHPFRRYRIKYYQDSVTFVNLRSIDALFVFEKD